jgi:hypothetical protein
VTDQRPIPLLGDVSLTYVQRIEHRLEAGFSDTRIAGLDGELQQRTGRPSHRIDIAGVLLGDTAADDLKSLQLAVAGGEEVTFASDITTALDLQRVVVKSFHAEQLAGHAGRYAYELSIAESAQLPPPAQVEGFGGLDEFGVGDLGFDTDLLGDLEGLADDLAGAVDGALDALDQLQALAALGDLPLSGLLEPLSGAVDGIGRIGSGLGDASRRASDQFTPEGGG